jgi:hypothetical protein
VQLGSSEAIKVNIDPFEERLIHHPPDLGLGVEIRAFAVRSNFQSLPQ